MSDLIHLEPQPVEVRDLEKREITGRVIPYGEQILVRGRPESFTIGALEGITAAKVKLFDHHDRAVGKAIALEERQDGAYASFYVSKTARGNELLELASDGVLSFSPGFVPGTQTRDGVHTRIQSMPEVSLVSMPAYSGAQVLAVREQENPAMSDTPIDTDPAPVVDPVDLSPLETRMDSLATQLDKLQTSVQAPPPAASAHRITPLRWFHAVVQEQFNKTTEYRERLEEDFQAALPQILETRALDNVVGTYPQAVPSVDASGLVIEEFIGSQLVNVLDTRRPLFASMGSFPMPRSGVARIPIVTQHTEVAARGTQKTEVPSRSLIVDSALHEAVWYAGAVDIAIELIRTSELSVLDLVWNDLLGQYAIATEDGIADLFDAAVTAGGFTFSGAVLTTTSYAAFAEDVATQALVVRTNTGAPATKLAVTSAQWIDLVAMVDGFDRRQFAANPSNSDGTINLNAESFMLPGGIEVFHVPGIARAYLYNGEAFKVADGGPERVEALNVALMGHDLGLLGRIMLVPRIPSGVVVFGISA